MNGSSDDCKSKISKKDTSSRSKFSCKNCGKNYSFRGSFKKHKTVCLQRMMDEFECSICGKKFLHSRNLRRHKVSLHSKQLLQLGEDISTFFECNGCGKKFSRKDNLKFHIIKCQTRVFEEDLFICAICGKRYTKKATLKWHFSTKHSVEKMLRCDRCNASFKGSSRREDLAEHLTECSLENKNERITCVLCGAVFASRKNVLFHMTGDDHKIVLHHEHLRFSSEKEFKEWKANIEKTTPTIFRNDGTRNFRFSTVSKFVCHRSVNSEPKTEDRQRRVKLQGTKKIGGFCPAEIVLDKRNEDGLCRVSYVSTHLGHTELAHLYLSKRDRASIASKILMDGKFNEILTEFAKFCHGKSFMDSSCLLTKKDLNNISRDYSVEERKFLYNSKDVTFNEKYIFEVMSLEVFLGIHQNSVLFVKKLGKICDNPFHLNEKDSVIIVMTAQQKQILKKYVHKVILADSTFDLPEKEFLFMTLSVIDDYDEAIPVAFAVCNRASETFIDVFFAYVRNEIGTLNTEVFMSCPQPDFFNRWTRIVGYSQPRSFFKWHTNELWQSQLKTITNSEKRKEMRNRLREISTYLDIEMFQTNLEDLLANTDPELKEFLSFFRNSFYQNVENWAYCYRNISGFSTKVWTESFNRTLKHFYSILKKIKSMKACLAMVSDYLNTKECDVKKKEIRGKLCNKLTELRRQHDEFVKKEPIVSVESVPDLGWYLSVSCEGSDVEKIHLIRECEDICRGCKLYCKECDACIHQYQCTCADNTLRNIMCHHIHALCMHLNTKKYEAKVESIVIHSEEISGTEEYSLVTIEEISTDSD